MCMEKVCCAWLLVARKSTRHSIFADTVKQAFQVCHLCTFIVATIFIRVNSTYGIILYTMIFRWHTGIPGYFIAHGWRITLMVSCCIQNLKSKYKKSKILSDSKLISKLAQLSQLFSCSLYLCAEVCRYKVCRWEAEIPFYVFLGIRVKAHIKCAVDACEHYRSILNRYIYS